MGNIIKKKVLLLSIHYPLTIARYFENALRRRDDVELKTVGPYTGANIPWMGGVTLNQKYANPPTISIPMESQPMLVDWRLVKAQLGSWVPDLIITVDAGINWAYRPDVKCPVVTIGTDGHCLNYDRQRAVSDKFFNMHKHYAKSSDIWLPYCFDPGTHYQEIVLHKTDVALIGMPYLHRVKLVNELRARSISVAFENGPVFEEYRRLNCASTIGLNYASEKDLNARVFEIMAMGLVPVINRVPDLKEMNFIEGTDYIGFDDVAEAVAQVQWVLGNPDAAQYIADNAYHKVWKYDEFGYPQHSYDARIRQLLMEVGLA